MKYISINKLRVNTKSQGIIVSKYKKSGKIERVSELSAVVGKYRYSTNIQMVFKSLIKYSNLW